MIIKVYLEKVKDPPWYGEQDENGVDLSLISENLRRTPAQRLRRCDRATSDALCPRVSGLFNGLNDILTIISQTQSGS
jgi:hypothetical protein